MHSGDIGRLDPNGNLIITGRIKELIVTAGGENIPPVLIENVIKEELKIISNCMLIGDMRKYLSILITLKHAPNKDGSLSNKLTDDVIAEFKSIGSNATTAAEARNDAKVKKYIEDGIQRANKKAASKA